MSQKDFERRIIKLQNSLLGFARSLTRNDDDAKDLLQETSLKALSNPTKYHERNLKGWLCTIMRNLFLNDCRHTAHSSNYREDFIINETPHETQTPTDAFSADAITRIIALLPPENRTLFTLYLQGYHYDEIASRLGLPIGTVKNRIFRIKRNLQAHRKMVI